jgi:hypothetical protein
MRFPLIHLREAAVLAGVCASSLLGGCGNSCFVGYSVNGNGGVIVKAGNPPPVCTLNQAQGMVRAALVKIPVCVNCAPVVQVQHFFVVLRGMQIHGESGDGGANGWIDLAPGLATSPRRFDLVGDSLPEPAVTSAIVPAGSYDTLRLEFASEEPLPPQGDEFGEGQCDAGASNCLIAGDGRIVPLSFAGDTTELLLQLTKETKPLLVLPDSATELQIQLGTRQFLGMTSSSAGKPPMQLVGEVVERRSASAN